MYKPKKVLLINPRNKKIRNTFPHLGLAMISAVLKRAGHQLLVLDYLVFPTIPSINSFMKRFKPDVVGISIYSASLNEALKVIEEVKNYNVPIIIGGPHTSIHAKDLINIGVDYIVKGILVALIKSILRQVTVA